MNDREMNLEDTIEGMRSEDYKERFRVEFQQLIIRIRGLERMLDKYKKGTLQFTPTCSYDLLNGQLKAMNLYASYLRERAVIEDIELN